MTVFDATQLHLQAPWAHCFARTPFPVLCALRVSCLLSLNLLTFALISEELKPGVFRAAGSGDVDPSTSTCLQGTHPNPAQWTLVKPRHNPHTSGCRQWCSTCGTWALRQDSCFSALSTHPQSDNLSQRLKPLQEGCLRCGGPVGVWEPTPPSPSFSKPPLLSGPRFFLQLEEDAEEVITSIDTSCGTGLNPSQAGRYNGSAGLSPTRPPRSLSSRADDSQTSRASGIGPAAQARRQDGGWSGIKARPSVTTQQCELCDSAPSCHTWAVKGGWLRKARNRVKASGAESNQSTPLQLASNWRRGTTHQLCSGCKAWAFEIASHGEDSTQNTVTSPEPWARLTEILMLEPAQAMLPKPEVGSTS